MPYLDLRDHQEGISMIKTIRKNFRGATKKQIEKASLARTLQRQIGHPPEERYMEIVSFGEGGLKNLPIAVAAIIHSRVIYGPNIPRLRGAMTRDTNVLKVKEERVAIQRDFYIMHKMVILTADVMFINGVPFLVTFSRNIKFWTAECVPRRTAKLLAKSMKKVISLYIRTWRLYNKSVPDGWRI